MQESFRIHQGAVCCEPKEFDSAPTCYWQGSDHQPLLKAANMGSSSPCPEKLSGALSSSWGCSFLKRERKQQPAQHKPADRTNKAKGQHQALAAASSSLQEYRNWMFSPFIPSSTAPTLCLSLDPQVNLDTLIPGLEVLAGPTSSHNTLDKRYQICLAVGSKGYFSLGSSAVVLTVGTEQALQDWVLQGNADLFWV